MITLTRSLAVLALALPLFVLAGGSSGCGPGTTYADDAEGNRGCYPTADVLNPNLGFTEIVVVTGTPLTSGIIDLPPEFAFNLPTGPMINTSGPITGGGPSGACDYFDGTGGHDYSAGSSASSATHGGNCGSNASPVAVCSPNAGGAGVAYVACSCNEGFSSDTGNAGNCQPNPSNEPPAPLPVDDVSLETPPPALPDFNFRIPPEDPPIAPPTAPPAIGWYWSGWDWQPPVMNDPVIPPTTPWTPAAPLVNLTVSPGTIASGASAILTWSASDATLCTGTGFSTGGATLNVMGVSTGALKATETYSIRCTGPGGAATDAETVFVSGGTLPDLTADSIAATPIAETLSVVLGATIRNIGVTESGEPPPSYAQGYYQGGYTSEPSCSPNGTNLGGFGNYYAPYASIFEEPLCCSGYAYTGGQYRTNVVCAEPYN